MSCSSHLSYSSCSSHLQSKDAALFVYAAWGTRDGRAVLGCDQTRQAAYQAITIRLRSRFCHVISVGGTASQIHLIVRFPASLPISDIIRIGQAAAGDAIVRVRETFEGRPFPAKTLWEPQYTTHTLSVMDAHDAHSYLRRQVMERDVEVTSPRGLGQTYFRDDAPEKPHEIAVTVNAEAFFDHYFEIVGSQNKP